MAPSAPRAESHYVRDTAELRPQVADSLQQRSEVIVNNAVAVSAFAGMESIAPADRTRLVDVILQLITHAVREGTIDSRGAAVTDPKQALEETPISVRTLFNVVYLIERSALDELAVEESFGAISDPWPVISQMLRRASFDVCATLSEARDQRSAEVTDSLTTLHTRAVFVAALDKEIQRSERFGRPFAVILIDIDRLADINATHGHGAGDFVIERVGIVVHNYFRETDWVARSSGGTFAVLLPETQRTDAKHLAERVRIAVGERLQLRDYRPVEPFPVTVSVGVLIAESVDQSVQVDQLLVEAEEALGRAKKGGHNRVECADAIVGRAATRMREEPSLD